MSVLYGRRTIVIVTYTLRSIVVVGSISEHRWRKSLIKLIFAPCRESTQEQQKHWQKIDLVPTRNQSPVHM